MPYTLKPSSFLGVDDDDDDDDDEADNDSSGGYVLSSLPVL